jgi:hypothetical protein
MRARVPSRYDRIDQLRRSTRSVRDVSGGVVSRYGTGPFRRGGGGIAAPRIEPPDPLAVFGSLLWGFWDARSVVLGVGISQFNDLSGNGRHMPQASGPNQMGYVAAGHNGMPHATGDGTQFARLTGITSIPAGSYVSSFAICRFESGATGGRRALDMSSSNYLAYDYSLGGGAYVGRFESTSQGSGVEVIRPAGELVVLVRRWDPSTVGRFYINGALQTDDLSSAGVPGAPGVPAVTVVSLCASTVGTQALVGDFLAGGLVVGEVTSEQWSRFNTWCAWRTGLGLADDF